ncbi:hypothetical protein LINPERPRIM_LOCUS1364 [Linum perenne]
MLQSWCRSKGQAGITKATVSVVFENSDRKLKPSRV